MIDEDARCQGQCIGRLDVAVAGNVHDELIVLSIVANTGIFNGEVDLMYRRVDLIDRNGADWQTILLILIR